MAKNWACARPIFEIFPPFPGRAEGLRPQGAAEGLIAAEQQLDREDKGGLSQCFILLLYRISDLQGILHNPGSGQGIQPLILNPDQHILPGMIFHYLLDECPFHAIHAHRRV